MSAPTILEPPISDPLDHRRIYPSVCVSCPNNPATCLETVRRICVCTQLLIDDLGRLADSIA